MGPALQKNANKNSILHWQKISKKQKNLLFHKVPKSIFFLQIQGPKISVNDEFWANLI